jgi:hypothetical protein
MFQKRLGALAIFMMAIQWMGISQQNVGIGTNTPAAKLHVRSQHSGTQIVLEETSTAAFLRMSAEPNNTGPYIGTTSNHQFSLVANNVPVIYLTTTGNVGIGLDNPQQRVGIRGGMVLDQDNQNTGTLAYTLKFGNNSGEAIGSKRNAGNNQFGLDFYTNNLHRMTIANNGNVGIGTSNPQSTLEIAVGNGRQFGFRNDIIPTLEITSTNPNDPLAGIMRVRNAIELFPNAAGTVAAKMDIRNKQGNPTIELNGDNGEIKARNMPGVRHRFTSRVNNIIGQTGSIVLESMRVNIPMAGMIKISANFFVAARGTNIVNMDYQINDNTPGQFTTLRNVNVNHEDATGHYYIEWVGFVQPGNKLYELKVFNKSNQHDLAFTVSAITVEFLGRELADW